MGKNVIAYGMVVSLGQTRMQPTISTSFVPKWSMGKSNAENGVPSYQLEGADSYPKPLTDKKKPVAAESLVKPTSRFGNCQITPFSTHRLVTEELSTEGKVPANFELTTEVRFLGPVWGAAAGAWTDALTNESHLPASQTGLGTCLPVNWEARKSSVFHVAPCFSISGISIIDSDQPASIHLDRFRTQSPSRLNRSR